MQENDKNQLNLKSETPSPWQERHPQWDPIVGLKTIRNTMFELMSDIFYQSDASPFDLPWKPPVDMTADENNLYINTNIPGGTKEDIQIHTTGDLLIIQGNIPSAENQEQRKIFTRECPTGDFSRSLPLPYRVIPDRIKAIYQQGVLMITLPIKDREENKSIKIEIE